MSRSRWPPVLLAAFVVAGCTHPLAQHEAAGSTLRPTGASWCRAGQLAVSVPAAEPDHVPFAGGVFTDSIEVHLRGAASCRVEGSPRFQLRLHRAAVKVTLRTPFRSYSLSTGFVPTATIGLTPSRRTASAEVDWSDRTPNAERCASTAHADQAEVELPHVSGRFVIPVPTGDLVACDGLFQVYPLRLDT